MLISKNIYGNQKNIFKELKKVKIIFYFLKKNKKKLFIFSTQGKRVLKYSSN